MTKQTTIFHHIPKTAGTTFYSILERQYVAEKRFKIDGMNPGNSLSAFEKLSMSERNDYALIYGHLADYFAPLLDKSYQYIIFLREPVDHFISTYYYIRRSHFNRYSKEVQRLNGIEQYIVFRKEKHLDNLQTRHTAGETNFALDSQRTPVDMDANGADVFLKAERRLKDIDFVLLTEYFNESVLILYDRLNWKSYPYYRFQNKTSRRPSANSFSAETIDKIKAVCYWDLKLYECAKEKFFKLYDRGDHHFKNRLHRFLFMNRLLNILPQWSRAEK